MGCVCAPTCKAALAEATRLYPNRRKTSDGCCGDPAHQARVSDHNAGNAWDLSDDPAHGCDAHALVEGIRRRQDKRVKYIISKRRICGPGSRGGGWEWKSYSGSNPHIQHAHVSIWPAARNDTSPWFGGQPKQTDEEEEVEAIKVEGDTTGALYLRQGFTVHHIRTPEGLTDLRKKGIVTPGPEKVISKRAFDELVKV